MDGKGFESDDSSISSSSNLSDHEVSSSSSTSPLSTSSTSTLGPLFELSATLMAELPVRRGLSKHFQGKSQSFTSLSEARCIEDLAKKEAPTCGKRRIKAWKSYGGFVSSPCSRTITKKSSRCSSRSLLCRSKPSASKNL
ncbi:uncharacterized protein LOC121999849 [Zingiber officinale]|uniref:uncharacterized protein LOC121999849 n=1 Tax=Zingiber officinale TaxID=94328 RepID=UPI001C4CB9DC|nr:uncharacterized protein LOC121999849 [Zingiber officinale]